MKQLLSLATIALVFGIGWRLCEADIFTAMADMETMLGAESEVTQVIDDYIKSEMKRLERLKSFSNEYTSRNSEAIKEGSKFVSNPVNAFLLIKRLTSDWKYVESMMKNNMADDFISNITSRREINEVKYPDQDDLTGAAIALLRLQDTYRLDTHDLARGIIMGEKMGEELTAHDCFEVGRAAYNDKDYYHTVMWMQEAYNRVEHEEPPSASMSDILEYLGFSLFQQGNTKRALALTKMLYDIDPDHPRAKGNIKWYSDSLMEKGGKKADLDDMDNLPPVVNQRQEGEPVPERDMYEALCRGEIPVSPKEIAKLYCYLKMDRPFLRLAPIKVEIMRFNPLAVMFRNILSDYEMGVVRQLATPRRMAKGRGSSCYKADQSKIGSHDKSEHGDRGRSADSKLRYRRTL